ncbi:MAG: PAS domain S-box protein [Candidatus Korobacteraceae bacterium]|jgi:PAS domain S-box-containing protein
MAAASQSSSVSKSLLILQITDNRADAELALLELSKAGFEVSTDVVDSLADVAGHMAAKSYDAVLADYHLPGWTGIDALPIVRQQQADIPFILVTGVLGEGIAVECVKNGVTDFVFKDHLARLPNAIRRALREKSLSDERNRALRELAESEARFRNLVEASPDAIFVHHKDGGLVFCNLATLKLLKAEAPQQLIGKQVSDIVHPDCLAAVKERISTTFERGVASAPVECVLTRLDGSAVAVESIAIPIVWGGVWAMQVVARDITERKRAEQTLLNWQKRLELAEQAALPIGFWEWELGTGMRTWSGEIYRQLGYPRGEVRGTAEEFLRRLHPEDRPKVEAAVRAVVSGLSQTYEVQVRVIRPDGTTCWLDSRAVLVQDGSPRMIGIAIDITKLRRSERSYRSIVERAPYGIYRSSSAGHFLMANPALVKMLGYDSESEMLSLDITRDVFCKFEERAQLVSRVIKAGEVKDAEYEWKRKDGRTVTVHVSVILVRKDSGESGVFQGFVQNVTERKNLAKQFWQAQKMEAVGNLAAGVAHDFNNLLMIFDSYAELINQRKVNDDKVSRYTEQIHKAATRGILITRQLLAFSRQQVLAPQVLDLNNVVGELSKVLPRLLGEDVIVATTLDPALHRVKLDPGQVEQIIMNLAVNARDAMPKGGRFEITTQNVELDARYAAAHSPMHPGAYVKLTVVDTGLGMDAETQARIFEPFFTTKEKGKGTGLGLAMVYGTVKQSGGFIWLSSEVGRGTRFDVFFPPVGESITERPAVHAASATCGDSQTILIVEDEESLRVATCEFLRSIGYTVLIAGDGAEAMRVCEQHTGSIDLVLTDVVMPGMNGIEVAKAMTLRYPNIRVVYMSGYIHRSIEGLGAGAVLLQKPFSLAALASKLRGFGNGAT